MDVIGAGLGRTGTLSLKAALELLGFAPCWHIEDMRAAGQLAAWDAVADGGEVDWREPLSSFAATSDFPACLYYREQAAAFPDARVVLTVRDPVDWAESMRALGTHFDVLRRRPEMQRWATTMTTLVWDRLGDLEDRDALVRFFEEHVAAVQRHIPAERLLVFDVREGWEPLCQFLDVPAPHEPFPRLNERGQLSGGEHPGT